eukprot:1790572-Prymnesium_polylepis.1
MCVEEFEVRRPSRVFSRYVSSRVDDREFNFHARVQLTQSSPLPYVPVQRSPPSSQRTDAAAQRRSATVPQRETQAEWHSRSADASSQVRKGREA